MYKKFPVGEFNQKGGLNISQFDASIENIQKVLDAINSEELSSQIEIARKIGVSPTSARTILSKLKPEVKQSTENIYKTNCKDAKDTEYYKKFHCMISLVLNDASLLLWQDTYLKDTFSISTGSNISSSEVSAVRSYSLDILKANTRSNENEIKLLKMTESEINEKVKSGSTKVNSSDKLNAALKKIKNNHSILLWQDKYIRAAFCLSPKEVDILRAAVLDSM